MVAPSPCVLACLAHVAPYPDRMTTGEQQQTSPAVAHLQRLRDEHRERQMEAGVDPGVFPAGHNTVQFGGGDSAAVRTYRSPDDADIAAAVLGARAIVLLDDRLYRAGLELARLNRMVTAADDERRLAKLRAANLSGRLRAVLALHSEGTVPMAHCSDGCCTHGTGVCVSCGEAYPCSTARAAEGLREGGVDVVDGAGGAAGGEAHGVGDCVEPSVEQDGAATGGGRVGDGDDACGEQRGDGGVHDTGEGVVEPVAAGVPLEPVGGGDGGERGKLGDDVAGDVPGRLDGGAGGGQ